jgi:hypothetical protein
MLYLKTIKTATKTSEVTGSNALIDLFSQTDAVIV